MLVYKLIHSYYVLDGFAVQSTRTLGYFRDIKSAKDAIGLYKPLQGYSDAPNAFVVHQQSVPGRLKGDSIFVAFIYAHTVDYNYDDFEFTLELGLFPTRESAQRALQRFKKANPTFLVNTMFQIEEIVDEYRIDVRYCTDGFVIEK